MVNSKKRREFNYMDDEDLRANIIKKYGYLHQGQYEFSRRFNTILVNGNYKNKEFATYAELSESSVSNYAKGYRIPDTNELERIARKVCVTTDYLLGRTDCLTFSAQEINNIIGLSEKAMKNLAMVNHNIEEIQDLMDPMEVSTVNKNKLYIFSSFIANMPDFSTFLTQIENYVWIKQKINETNNAEEKDILEDKVLRN